MGALVYEPCQVEISTDISFNLDEISREIDLILDNNEHDKDFNLDNVYRFGGSSGGSRPKAHIKDSDGYWIVKFPCRQDPANCGEQEYTANALAKKCGILTNEFKLFPSALCSGFFGAKRFDIVGTRRIHTVSLSSLLETTHRIPNLDYIHLFQVIQKICVNQNDLYEAYKRMCFNVLYGNKDDHGKNFAFIYDENVKGYSLSPAYDTTKTPFKSEHEMTVNGNGNPTGADLLNIAKKLKLSQEKCASECTSIIENIKEVCG